MQLPDEAIDFNYAGCLLSHPQAWTPLAEIQPQHLIPPERMEAMKSQIMQLRQQVLAERQMTNPPAKLLPLDSGFIDLPGKLLEQYRKKGDGSDLGRIILAAHKLKEEVDRVVVLGIGGSYLGARALFDALCPTYHNELPERMRMGSPRVYFEGNSVENDSFQDLLDLLENTCVDPAVRAERWGAVVISKSGETIETAVGYRVIRRELARFYGNSPEQLRKHVVPITGPTSNLRKLCEEDKFPENEILTIPDGVGGRYSVFSAVGLLPAAIAGLDVQALLLGASAMTQRFVSEPFERNPALVYAAVNHIMNTEHGKGTRVMAAWSKKLESLGFWYDQLLSESLGKQGKGPTSITVVNTRDLHSRGQQHQEGERDKVINNVFVKGTRHAPIQIGMADRNEDNLNQFARKTLPDINEAALKGTNEAYSAVARATTTLTLPAISEHTIGQLMQMLMLATVVEGRLLGVNPYGQPGVKAYKDNLMRILKESAKPPGT
jgi:glucose-6-phosphate isomerase